MSLATHSQVGYECAYCGSERDPANPVEGSYCSKRCYISHKGEKSLNLLRHDHTICANCGTQFKSVEEPTDEALKHISGYHSTKAVVGYEYAEKESDTGEKPIFSENGKERIISGLICGNCGNATTHSEFPEMQDRFLLEYASGILDTLEDKEDEHRKNINHSVFFEELIDDGDLEYALGKSLLA